jgi:hypothetical protein
MRRLLVLLIAIAIAPFAIADETPVPQPAQPSGSGRTQLFQVVLVRGSVTGPEEIVGIPKNAEKAIRDIRDFLPFKGYKVLDSSLIRIAEKDLGKVRVDGLPPQQYDIGIQWSGPSSRLSISWFQVMPVHAHGGTALPKGVAPEADHPIIDTSFSIDVGETIVVGSSRLGGDQALIILLTALPNH